MHVYCFLGNDSCASNPCKHICIAGNNSYTCRCMKNYTLAADNTSCIKCAQPQSRRINRIKPTWHVAICNASNEDTICSGTAINDLWVLTSAGCVCNDNVDKQSLSIRFAKRRVCFYKDTNELQLSVSNIYCFPGYDPNKTTIDLALIKLQSPIPLRTMRQSPPLCLQFTERIKNFFRFGKHVIMFGWGSVGKQVDQNDVLMSTGKVIIGSRSKCRAAFNSENIKFKSSAKTFCTLSNTTETCIGSYGSAVIAQRGQREFILGGVVGKKTRLCGTNESYQVNSITFHSNFKNWIKNIV